MYHREGISRGFHFNWGLTVGQTPNLQNPDRDSSQGGSPTTKTGPAWGLLSVTCLFQQRRPQLKLRALAKRQRKKVCGSCVFGCWLFILLCWLLIVDCCLLVVSCWCFVVGCCWLLVCDWWLVVGCWMLVFIC